MPRGLIPGDRLPETLWWFPTISGHVLFKASDKALALELKYTSPGGYQGPIHLSGQTRLSAHRGEVFGGMGVPGAPFPGWQGPMGPAAPSQPR